MFVTAPDGVHANKGWYFGLDPPITISFENKLPLFSKIFTFIQFGRALFSYPRQKPFLFIRFRLAFQQINGLLFSFRRVSVLGLKHGKKGNK